MPSSSRRAGRRVRALLAMAGVLVMAAMATPAVAIPPDGAGPDTPGTSASVSPATLEPCQTIGFTVTGFPGGETLYVKIDDGVGYGDTSVQGSGVWHMQAIPASGTVNGSFELPCDITAGAHWLRFLASEEVLDDDGDFQGVIGYTRRGGADFTVVSPSGSSGGSGATGSAAGGGSGGASGSDGGSATGSSGQSGQAPVTGGAGGGQLAGEGEVVVIDPDAVADAFGDAPPAEAPEPPVASGADLPADGVDAISAVVAGHYAVIELGESLAGQWVYVYAYSDPIGLGWQQVSDDGHITVSTLPLPDGEHRFVVLDAESGILGWTALRLGEEVEEASPEPADEQAVAVSAEASEGTDGGVPVVGLVGAVILVLVGAGAAWFVLRTGNGRNEGADAPSADAGARAGAAPEPR